MCVSETSSDEDLRARLQQHDEYFCRMVNLVPADLYLPKDEPDVNAKYFKNKRLAAPKQEKKEESKKGKKIKFDPANMKSVTDLQKERAEKEKKEKLEREADMQGDEDDEDEEEDDEMDVDDDDDDDDDSEDAQEDDEEEEDDDDDDEVEEEEGAKMMNGRAPKATSAAPSSAAAANGGGKKERGPLSLVGTTPRAKSIEELKERLRLKIEEARARRGGTSEGGNRKSAAGKKEDPKRNKPKQIGAKPGSQVRHDQAGIGQKSPQTMPRPSDQALDIQFGKMVVPTAEDRRLKKGGKNLVGLLKKAEEKEKRLKELQKSEDGKDEANAIMWRDALKQAHGEKVLDNPKLLKKTIKKKQKAKEKSAKQWAERTAKIDASSKEKQQKREANLKKRKAGSGGAETSSDAISSGGKKLRRAGFEGKRLGHEYLNKGKPGGAISGAGGKGEGGGGSAAGGGGGHRQSGPAQR